MVGLSIKSLHTSTFYGFVMFGPRTCSALPGGFLSEREDRMDVGTAGTVSSSIFQTFGSKAHAAVNYHRHTRVVRESRPVDFASPVRSGGKGPFVSCCLCGTCLCFVLLGSVTFIVGGNTPPCETCITCKTIHQCSLYQTLPNPNFEIFE